MKHVAITISLILGLAGAAFANECEVVDEVGAAIPRVVEVQLYIDGKPIDDDAKAATSIDRKRYPELYTTSGVIAYFGSKTCPPCRPQKQILKAHVADYNLIFYENLFDEEKGVKARELLKELEHDIFAPQVLVIEQGKKTAAFRGFTSWDKIAPKAKAARKSEPDETHIDIGPLHIDIDEDGVDVDIDHQREPRERRFKLFNGKFRERWENRERLQIFRQDGESDWRLRWEAFRVRWETFRDRMVEYAEVAIAWIVENWDTIVRVAMLFFSFV